MAQRYGFLYATDSHIDNGYREVEGDTYEVARKEWKRQMIIEGQNVRLDASQIVRSGGKRSTIADAERARKSSRCVGMFHDGD